MNFITVFLFILLTGICFVLFCFKLLLSLYLMSAIQPLGLWEAELVKVVRQMAIASFTIAISYACTVGPITKKDDEMC